MSKNEQLSRPPQLRAGVRAGDPPLEKVGPGNPPKHSRFRKGVSGNAKGRPKGSKNLATLLIEAANGQVTATIDGKLRKISKIQATTLQLATKAASGDPKSISQLIEWVDEIERRAASKRPEPFPIAPADKQIIDELFRRMMKSESLNAGGPVR